MFSFTVLWITIKRIIHNWKISLALLAGLVLAAGIMAAIPMYSAGSLQKSFIRQWIEQSSFRPPFTVIISHDNEYRRHPVSYNHLTALREYLESAVPGAAGRQAAASVVFARLGSNPVLPVGVTDPSFASPKGDMSTMSNLHELSEIVLGRWYQARDDGVVEVVVDETTLERNELVVGDKFTYWYPLRSDEPQRGSVNGYIMIECELVGMFRPKAGFTTRDWIYLPPFLNRLFAEPEVFDRELLQGRSLRARNFDMQWVFDYESVHVSELPSIIDSFDRVEARSDRMVPSTSIWHSPLGYFRRFDGERQTISLFLLALSMPAAGMILYYIVLLAGVSVSHRSKEITVMHSRGGGRPQVVLSFFLEWVILGAVAVAVGPWIGMFVAKAIGASSGFLDFVRRASIPVVLSGQAYVYALAAASVAALTGIVPAIGASGQTIVTFAQRQGRSGRRSVWHRFFLDFILLGLSIYGYSRLSWETFALIPGEKAPADPLLFFVPVVMILGAGLLILRLFPYVVALLRWITGKLPGVVFQLSFRRLSRSGAQYVPLMLLLILTVSLGIYSAAAARTLLRNYEDHIRYRIGADLASSEEWFLPDMAPAQIVSEPPFQRRLEIPGIVSASRVINGRASVRRQGQWSLGSSGNLMAVEPSEFARTAWFRDDLADAHFYEYLRLLQRHREGVLISTPLFRQSGAALGESLIVTYQGQEIPAYVAGNIDYWPSLNPRQNQFIIMNIDHVQDYAALEPYDVWYRLSDDADVRTIVDELERMGIYVTRLYNSEAEIAELKQEPYRMGFFGILSLSFLLSSFVTVVGFFVFSFFSIRSRTVQFGALRAMGLSGVQLISMIALELVITITTGFAIGTVFGAQISRMFLPFLRDRATALGDVPPFLVRMSSENFTIIAGVVSVLFVIALGALTVVLSRLQLSRALKLGEDA